jgi:hypothetical protein
MQKAVSITLLAACAGAFLAATAQAQPTSAPADIEHQRDEQMEPLRKAGVPSPQQIRDAAKRIFALPTAQQLEPELRSLAIEANAYANLVQRLADPYQRDLRENSQYAFVRNALSPPLEAYEKLGNEFKGIRNKAYFNLAEKAGARGDKIEAFFLYNDAYRLESFDCVGSNGLARGDCLRIAAEERLRQLLEITAPKPYTYWKTTP